MSEPRGTLLVVVARFPSATERFVPMEIRALEEQGFIVHVLACDEEAATGEATLASAPPRQTSPLLLLRGDVIHLRRPSVSSAAASVLAEALKHPRRLLDLAGSALEAVPRGPAGLSRALKGLALAFQALPRARSLGICHVHAHFLHLPMLVGRLVARSLLVTHSASAHARDVFAPDFRVAGLCRGASVVLACSEHLRAELERVTTKRDSEKIHVCRHGVDLSVLSPTPRRRIEAPLRILSVGRLVPKKGIDVLLEALARLKQRGVAFACRIAGDGPERERLLRRARGLPPGSVEFLGFQSFADMKDLYAWADVFALPCRVASDGDRDGVPNAILEAMASGVPVVASDAGGVSEVLTHKETGWLVPPNDPAALASALEEAGSEEELRSHLARGARAEVETRFDARKATETFVRLVVPAGRRE